ncbi:mitochondrial carrier domain-containing protein [Cyathus striatus]|nr:mitochondrial carrier domain-containing protein [Cyathus striatus]
MNQVAASLAQPDKQAMHYIIGSSLVGGISGCVVLVAPIDRVKILFQTSNPHYQKYAGTLSGAFRACSSIYKENGVRCLFQGHSATLIRIFPYAAIKFMAYDVIHDVCSFLSLCFTEEEETNARRFFAGAFSGTISVFFTYPLDVIRVRMAFHSSVSGSSSIRPSFVSAARQIYIEKARPSSSAPEILISKQWIYRFPALKLYRGFTATTIGIVPYAGVSFLSWRFLHSTLLPSGNTDDERPMPVADLAIGALSGALALTVSYPFEVIRRRMQVGGLTRPNRWLGWGETAREILNGGGWRGFYVGLGIGYLKVIPTTAVTFMVWQSAKRLL